MIHKYSQNGYNIVLDTPSGAVMTVSNCAYDILDYIQSTLEEKCPDEIIKKLSPQYSVEEIIDAYEELYILYTEDILFSEDSYWDLATELGPAPVKSLCLNVAHDCNLKCAYCFASQGDFGQEKCLMSLETAKAAIDFLIENSGTRKNLEVDFFGGEPLLNFELVKGTVEYARKIEKDCSKNFRFTLTTNGVLLTEDIIKYINTEMSNIVLSIDGRKHINDRMRYFANGKGCYDLIIPKYKALLTERGDKEYYVRGTYTRFNLDFADDVIHLFNEGFNQISIEPAVTKELYNYSIRESDLPNIFSEYEKLAKLIIDIKNRGEAINFFHFMLDLEEGPCAFKRLRGCSCGNEYLAITPEGDIYPCHQFIGIDEWLMGNVVKKQFDTGIKEKLSSVNVYSKSECSDCWAKFYCSGGCNANNYLCRGDVLLPHKITCEIEKKRIECALMIKAALSKDN